MPSLSRDSRWVDMLISIHSELVCVIGAFSTYGIKERGDGPVIIAYKSETVTGPYDQVAG